MKKLISIAFVFCLISCHKKEKDWTCTCTIHYPSGNVTVTEKITHKTKNYADKECSEFGHNNGGHTNPFECSIK